MKKLISIILTLTVMLTIAGCGGPKPEDTVNQYFTAAKSFDRDTMAECILADNVEGMDDLSEMLNGEADDVTKYFIDYFKTNARKMTYEITGTEVNEDKAVVTVASKYVDGGPLLKATIGSVFSKAIGMAFSGVEPTDEEMTRMFMETMQEQSKLIEETYKESTLAIDLVKRDNEWYIAEVSDEMGDVILSGFVTTAKELDETFNSID